jgi:predicted transport protein
VRATNDLSEDDVKAILEELEGLEVFGAGRRVFGWGLTGVVLGLGLAAVALVFESYFSWDDDGDADADGKPGPKPTADRKPGARKPAAKGTAAKKPAAKKPSSGYLAGYLAGLEGPLRELAEALDETLLGLGDDTQRAVLKRYVAYKRAGSNFACVAVRRSADEILVYLRLDPPPAGDMLPFMRDVTDVGHIGTGDLELRLADMSQLEAARGYLTRSYEAV